METEEEEEESRPDDAEMFYEESVAKKKARFKRRQKRRDAVTQGYVSMGTYNIQSGENVKTALKLAARSGIAILMAQERKGLATHGKLYGCGEWRQWSSGMDTSHGAGVAFFVYEKMKERINVLDVSFPSPRVGIMKVIIEGRPTTIVNMYAKFRKKGQTAGEPEDADERLDEKVFELALEQIRNVPLDELLVVGDLNAHITHEDWIEHGHLCKLDDKEIRYMSEKTDDNGKEMLDFCDALNLKLINLASQTKWNKVCTYHGFQRNVKTLIDYIAIPATMHSRSQNCITIDGYGVGSDHKLVACKYWIKDRATKKEVNKGKVQKLPPETIIERKLRMLMRTAVPRPWYHPEEAVWSSLDTEMAVMRLNAHRGRDKEKIRELKKR